MAPINKTVVKKEKKTTKKTDTVSKPRKTTSARSKAKRVEKGIKTTDTSEIESLQAQLNETTQKYGELLAQVANMQNQKNLMLSKILLGLYVIGIGPNEIFAMCQKMFQPVTKK